jgi:hypothetical protein
MKEKEDVKRPRFGNVAACEMYGRLMELAVANDIFRVYELEADEADVTITLFNSFRIVRHLESERVSVFERDYLTGEWKPSAEPDILEVVPVWPIYDLPAGMSVAIKGRVLAKLRDAAGYEAKADAACERWRREYRSIENLFRKHDVSVEVRYGLSEALADERKPDRMMLVVAKNAFANRLFGDGSARKNGKAKCYVDKKAVYNGLKGFRAAFYRHFRDRELFRAILSMNHKSMTLGDYLYFARHREAVLKVWKERRNLMPLLPYITSRFWGEDELFSVENWTTTGGFVANPEFARRSGVRLPSQRNGTGGFKRLRTRTSFRWLAKSRNSVVKAWVGTHRDPRVADIMTEIKLPKETAALIEARTVSELSAALAKLDAFDLSVTDHRQRIVWLFRAYAAHWSRRRSEVGYRAMIKEMLYRGETGDVFDYLVNEGFRNGILARNATWSAVVRRSEEWHQNRRLVMFADTYDDIEKREWDSLVGPLEINGCSVVPLTDVEGVFSEGNDMAHCVGSYASMCSKDRYRVFSIKEPDGKRSTLGIYISEQGAVLDQVRGAYNAEVSGVVQRVAEQVTALYSQAIPIRDETASLPEAA